MSSMRAPAGAAVVPITPAGSTTAQNPSLSVESRPFAVGSLLAGRFRITALIAVGGTSCLYRALDQHALSTGVGTPDVALKIPRRLADGDYGTDLAAREVAIGRLIRHRNVLNAFDLQQERGRFFLVGEFVDGEALRERLRRAGGRGLAPAEYRPVLRELVDALEATHRSGLVHSDVKPGNVLLTRQGELRLIDFATARPRVATPGLDCPRFQGYSPAYASPQALRDEPADPADDVYSLACVTYEMVTGRHPFDRRAATEALEAGLRPQRPAGLPWAQWWVLQRAMAFARGRRYASPARFRRDFALARYAAPTAWGLALVGLCGFAALMVLGSGGPAVAH